MTVLSGAEFALTVLFGLLFWAKGFHRKFPAMGGYLGLRVASAPVLFWLVWATQHFHTISWYEAYFFVYWPVYFASAVVLYFVCMDIFSFALSVFPGLTRLGAIVFRWAALVSLIVSFSTFSFVRGGTPAIPDVAFRLMRSISILELCLLAFLCICMNALRLSIRDLSFGIALGLGLMAANDFFTATSVSHNSSLVASWQFISESVILLTYCLWILYSVLPQPERKPVMVPVSSPVYRWNEIASALGYTGTQVAVQQPSNGFFLTDVENVVEKVLARNLKDRKSES